MCERYFVWTLFVFKWNKVQTRWMCARKRLFQMWTNVLFCLFVLSTFLCVNRLERRIIIYTNRYIKYERKNVHMKQSHNRFLREYIH